MPAAKFFFALVGILAIVPLDLVFPEENRDGVQQEERAGSPILAYQVGAFLDKGNADRLVAELFKLGFYGIVGRKTVRGRSFWTVTVEAPPNPFENFQTELLDAGFPSFPIR
ncbi:MAG: SPOR domain-containing protein [Rectinemataceae bacterium]